MNRGFEARRKTGKFEQACIEHMDALYSTALKLAKNHADAEELVQDTYVKAFRFQKKFEWGTNLKAWLFRILTNTFINDFRHRGHQRRYTERAATEPIYDEILDRQAREYAADPEGHAFANFFKKELDRALEELPDEFKTVILLSDLQGFSYKEIAEILECPIGTVMSRLHRGRRLLQRELIDFALEAGIKVKIAEPKDDGEPASIEDFRRLKRGQP